MRQHAIYLLRKNIKDAMKSFDTRWYIKPNGLTETYLTRDSAVL